MHSQPSRQERTIGGPIVTVSSRLWRQKELAPWLPMGGGVSAEPVKVIGVSGSGNRQVPAHTGRNKWKRRKPGQEEGVG